MTTRLAPFQYRRPETLDQLFDLVSQTHSRAQRFTFLAGGTDVIPQLKQHLESPDIVISLSGLNELKQIKLPSRGKIQIGAMTSITHIIDNSDIQQLIPALGDAAKKVASPQIRNQATIGGNILVTNRCIFFNQSEHNRLSNTPCFKAEGEICHVVKSAARGKLPLCRARAVSDTVPVLLLLDAKLVFAGSDGESRVNLRDFYRPDGIDSSDLQPDQVLCFVEIDVTGNKRICYEKLALRDTFDFPSLGVAVGIETTDIVSGGQNVSLSVAHTGVNTHPAFMEFKSEDYPSYREMLNAACEQATRNALTFQQDLFPRGYRKKMIEVYIRRAAELLKEGVWT